MHLFEEAELRGLKAKNRIVVSPMCQYSAENGLPTSWHTVHLGSHAVGGAGIVFTEATAVEARGRISPEDTGIWSDAHAEAWRPIAQFIRAQGSIPAMQLAHAGRKASTAAPWNGGKEVKVADGGWETLAPSALRFQDTYPLPTAMTHAHIDEVVAAFGAAAKRAIGAGFELVEIHGAHGYLIHEFLSPLSNQRTDEYGVSLENRLRLLRRVIASVRENVPEKTPVFLRISATDWVAGGWDLEQACALAEIIRNDGVDLIDVSSGGLDPRQQIPVGAGYQTGFSAEIKRRSGMKTGTVGGITAPEQADHILRSGQADFVFLARELLRDPYWPRRAAAALHAKIEAPKQYARAW